MMMMVMIRVVAFVLLSTVIRAEPLTLLGDLPPGAIVYSGGAGQPPGLLAPEGERAVDRERELESALLGLVETGLVLPDARPFHEDVHRCLAAFLDGLATPLRREAFVSRARSYPAVREAIARLVPPVAQADYILLGPKSPTDPATTRDRLALLLMDLIEAALAKNRAGGGIPQAFVDRAADALIATLALPTEPYERRRLVDQLYARAEIKAALAGREAGVEAYLRDGLPSPVRPTGRRLDVEDRFLGRLENALAEAAPAAVLEEAARALVCYMAGLAARADRQGYLTKARGYPRIRERYLDPHAAGLQAWVDAGL
jgi:hypothetical protein